MKIFRLDLAHWTKAISLGLCAALISGCGGGGGDPGGVAPGTPTLPVKPASIEMNASAFEIPSASTADATVTVTALVKNSANAAMADQEVRFGVSSGAVIGSPAKTDANGVATVKVVPGTDRSNRAIAVQASVGGVSNTVNLAVSGTRIALSGSNSLLVSGGPKSYTVLATDSAGKGIADATLTVRSSGKGTISPSTLRTDPAGRATFTYTPTTSGVDTLSVAGLGANGQLQIGIGSSALSFVSIQPGALLEINKSHSVTVRLQEGGNPVANREVIFTTSRGRIDGENKVVTNANGEATASVIAETAGVGTLTATVTGSATAASTDVEFVSTSATSLILQANPSAVAPNSPGTSTNTATLDVLVRDAKGNAVKNSTVSLSVEDPSGGSVNPATVTTDSNGRAQSRFIAGANATATNGVKVTATLVSDPSVQATTTLTVSARAIFLTFGTGNTIKPIDTTMFGMDYTVYVADSAGAALANQAVVVKILPLRYAKGQHVIGTTTDPTTGTVKQDDHWSQSISATCRNEDLNNNGILDPGEDVNGNGQLEPGAPAVIRPPDSANNATTVTLTTDGSGFAKFEVRYLRDRALWAEMQITATTAVAGTESTSRSTPFWLPALASDMKNVNVSPPGQFSPYGQGSSCSTPG